jgi:putative FmdB family regulatory protein
MPIYEYRCTACNHELEALQKLSEAPLRTCPKCGKESLTKLVSAAGFQLKGSGWYATDFKHSGAKPAAKDATKSEAKAEGGEGKAGEGKAGDGKGSDAKPAEAPAAAATSDTKPKSDAPAAASSGNTPAES